MPRFASIMEAIKKYVYNEQLVMSKSIQPNQGKINYRNRLHISPRYINYLIDQ